MSAPYLYQVRLTPTSISTSKTLTQIKPVTATIYIVRARVFQVTKTSSEMWEFQFNRWTGAFTPGTVTSFTPTVKGSSQDPTSLAVGGTSATGVNATVEPSGGTQIIVDEVGWNLLNGEWMDIPVPEDRIEVRNGELFTFKLISTPAAAATTGVSIDFLEYN